MELATVNVNWRVLTHLTDREVHTEVKNVALSRRKSRECAHWLNESTVSHFHVLNRVHIPTGRTEECSQIERVIRGGVCAHKPACVSASVFTCGESEGKFTVSTSVHSDREDLTSV